MVAEVGLGIGEVVDEGLREVGRLLQGGRVAVQVEQGYAGDVTKAVPEIIISVDAVTCMYL